MDIQRTGGAHIVPAAMSEKAATAASAPAARPVVSQVPATTAEAVSQSATVPSSSEVAQAVKAANKALQQQNLGLEFTVDEDSERTIVRVVDQETSEVIRQIPSEEMLEIAKALDQQLGLLIRQKA